jgi:hypothetical protein
MITYLVHWQLTTNQWEHEQMSDESVPASSGAEGADNPTEDKTRLISLAEAAEMYGFSRIYLAELARRGRLGAQKVGNMWVTSPSNMEDFIRSRKKRGAYRNDIELDNT